MQAEFGEMYKNSIRCEGGNNSINEEWPNDHNDVQFHYGEENPNATDIFDDLQCASSSGSAFK